MAGVTSTPMPSPSTNGMMGSSGTFSEPSVLIRILAPTVGTTMCSKRILGSALANVVTALRNQQCQFQSLLMVQPRIHRGTVGPLQVRIGQTPRAPGALGHILAGQFNVHAAQIRPHVCVDAERQVDLLQDVLEAAGLSAPGRGF